MPSIRRSTITLYPIEEAAALAAMLTEDEDLLDGWAYTVLPAAGIDLTGLRTRLAKSGNTPGIGAHVVSVKDEDGVLIGYL